ncbi:hypothetical protein B0H16DRAFT_1473675 [Mycena metata]|uniref:Uncharacterized protein n=1 Tax=Mycena metata TaxID=1033252 RepID=A0AAD7HK27_9AGAR|nr:hypothetical protein B0H16DRAFT_1473675 [Mycena metata]
MLYTRLIVLVVASIVTLSLGNTMSPVNTTSPKGNGVLTNGPVPPLRYSGDCDAVPVVAGGCTQMPARQINAMSPVQVPCGWVCTFYKVNMCDASNAVSITTLAYPGSAALSEEVFDDVVDYVECNTEN